MTSASRSSNRAVMVALLVVAAGLVVWVLVAKISPVNSATSQQKAQQLVAAARAAGVAPHLTVGVAEALYGSHAPAVCQVFKGGLNTAEKNDLLGNPSNRRPKTITTNAVTYGRLVVKIYCPSELSHYNAVVSGLNPVKSNGSA
jgi:hypothetical protein